MNFKIFKNQQEVDEWIKNKETSLINSFVNIYYIGNFPIIVDLDNFSFFENAHDNKDSYEWHGISLPDLQQFLKDNPQ